MEFATKAAREFVEKYPIYTLRADDIGTAAAWLLLKEMRVENAEVRIILGL
jgi:hypothetical protein